MLHIQLVLLGFSGSRVVKNPPASVGDSRDSSLIPKSKRYPGVENGNPFQYSCLENSIDREVWWATVHRVIELNMTETTHSHTHAHAYYIYIFFNKIKLSILFLIAGALMEQVGVFLCRHINYGINFFLTLMLLLFF